MSRVALIGLGEVGRVFAEDLPVGGITDLVAWDIAFDEPTSKASHNARDLAIAKAADARDAVSTAELVISAVTPAQCVDVAEAVSLAISNGAWFFDLNSASPGHKRASADIMDGHGGRYLEVALMSPIGPRRLNSPFLLGGPHAQHFAAIATSYGLTDATAFSDTVGRAAAVKLSRSVIVKGLEAIFTESMLTARHYGVEAEVLDSLSNILPEADWDALAAYFISRSMVHGVRRSEEMVEAAATVADADVEPLMARATLERQAWAAAHADGYNEASSLAATTAELVDILRKAMEEPS
jgi:3-hydroxyisobutyrate dehydrogenase-like beta-hydroxyacid dehydrogenase